MGSRPDMAELWNKVQVFLHHQNRNQQALGNVPDKFVLGISPEGVTHTIEKRSTGLRQFNSNPWMLWMPGLSAGVLARWLLQIHVIFCALIRFLLVGMPELLLFLPGITVHLAILVSGSIRLVHKKINLFAASSSSALALRSFSSFRID